jgi:hypothetical protein
MRNVKVLQQPLLPGLLFSFLSAASLCAALLCAASLSASAQTSNQEIASLSSKISQDSIKLVKLKSQVQQCEMDKKTTANQAQQSADENKTAANRLANDPQDKKLARRADNAASDARIDAKKARSAADKLEGLNKDIDKLSEKLLKERAKMDKFVRSEATAPANATAAAQKDSTQ